MVFRKPSDKIVFADDNAEAAFNKLAENSPLKNGIKKAFLDLRENSHCGARIRKELIPKEYIRNYGINNLWWYPLPKGWRLVYSLTAINEVKILAIIIEYFNHKEYERRFKY